MVTSGRILAIFAKSSLFKYSEVSYCRNIIQNPAESAIKKVAAKSLLSRKMFKKNRLCRRPPRFDLMTPMNRRFGVVVVALIEFIDYA